VFEFDKEVWLFPAEMLVFFVLSCEFVLFVAVVTTDLFAVLDCVFDLVTVEVFFLV